MPAPPVIRDATPDDIEAIRDLADRTWRTCYPGIISLEQIDYMLGWMYAPEKLDSEMREGSIRYLLASTIETGPAGFAAYGPGESSGENFLHKLYVDPARQRLGIGAALLGEVVARSASTGIQTLSLRVNRRNAIAIAAYRKNEFLITGEVCADIGNGFVMDDYVMTRPITGPGS